MHHFWAIVSMEGMGNLRNAKRESANG